MKAPVFVKVDEYKDIMDLMTLMRDKLAQARALLDKIAKLKAEEDAELGAWKKDLDDVESRIASIDRSLVEPSL